MKIQVWIIITVFSLFLVGCDGEQKTQPIARVDVHKNPRLSNLNPDAWKGLSMAVIISDFQESDGILSSFICDEIRERLVTDPLDSLQELNSIDQKSRIYAFEVCLSFESDDPSTVLRSIGQYSKEYPDLIQEIKSASK